MQACDFSSPTRFLIGTVSKGLTNQRLGTLSYLVLAAALNRTLILSSVLSGNQIMCRGKRSGCLKALPISEVYDLRLLRARLPPRVRACVAPPDFEAPADTAEAARDPELARARVPPGRVVAYTRRRWGLERAKFLRLREIWQDLLCCESDEYFRISRALVPAEPIRRAAAALAATAAARWPRRRLTWLHLRLEADWASDGAVGRRVARCPFNNASSIVAKVSAALTRAPRPRAPTADDVLYVAGGAKHPALLAELGALFGNRLLTAASASEAVAVALRFERLGGALPELNLGSASVDFVVGLLSDTIIGCDCSTFSKEVVRLRSLGRGAPKDTWTFSGPPYPQQRGLAPFLRDDPIYHSAVRSPYLPRGDLQRSARS